MNYISNEELLEELVTEILVNCYRYPKEYNLLLKRLDEGTTAIKRYEVIRKLTPAQFRDVYDLNARNIKTFDEIIDDLLPFYGRT